MAASQAMFFPAPPETCKLRTYQYKNIQKDIDYSSLIKILRENWSKRQENGGIDPIKEEVKRLEQEEKENQPEENPETVARTVRKENVFEDELTEEEMKIIAMRVAEQRKKYEEFEKRENQRKIDKLQSLYPYLTDEECLESIEFCKEERRYDDTITNTPEDEAACKFATDGFWHHIRKRIAKKHEEKRAHSINDHSTEVFADRSGLKRQRKSRKCTHVSFSGIRIGRKEDGRLRLDDALKRVKESGSMDGWSEARIKAYQSIDENPNAYYYRFNAPNEEQRYGAWTKEEEKLFFERLKECKIGENYEWGIFSIGIPGRVGYQCSNFYRRLLKEGRVKDDNYYFDAKGEPKFKFKSSNKIQVQDGSATVTAHAPKRRRQRNKSKGKHKKKRKSSWEDSSDENSENDTEYSDDEEYRPGSHGTRSRPQLRTTDTGSDNIVNSSQNFSESSDQEDVVVAGYARDGDNPIPEFIDAITLEPIRRPAISPYGHVLGYSTWKRALQNEPKNTCPFTKKPLRVQDLVILTWENIEQYRSSIVH
ncbi:hypothetical protein GpartN1_g818.t1 [Galdieria partita]|uniref:Myb-like domain-containing protein n=1 Tax=Galdieria partita TaxID=83374 RepID=A0A9C7PSU0_9RHOD|nr:hypothetical protein GpartN1_g818.t1 [Galdieria partita]